MALFSHPLMAQDWRIPAFYSVGLEQEHELHDFAFSGPCENQIQLRSNRLPVDIANLSLGAILELSEDHELIGEWATPMDSSPVAVKGDLLQIQIFNSANKHVFVSVDAKITPAFDDPPNELVRIDCPEVKAMPHISEHLVCGTLLDQASGIKRIFSWAPACT